MSEFNVDIYKVKGTFIQDETEPTITGFYYQDKSGGIKATVTGLDRRGLFTVTE